MAARLLAQTLIAQSRPSATQTKAPAGVKLAVPAAIKGFATPRQLNG